jgi:two-component system, NarL family, sensor histidine kinase UhpB
VSDTTDTTDTKIAILLVEDDPTDTRLLISLLDHADLCEYSLQAVATAADAERSLVHGDFDVVLLDLSLPDCDGLVSVERILRVAPTTPIVVLTGRDDYELGLRSIEAGAQDFLVKGEVKGNTILRCAQWSIARAASGSAAPPAEERWASIDHTVASIAIIDQELKIVMANPAFVSATGRSEAELARLPLTELVDVDDIVGFVLDIRATLRDEAPTRLVPVRFRTPVGEQEANLNFARITPLGDEAPRLLLMISPRVDT